MRQNDQAWTGAAATRNNFLPASRYYSDKFPRTLEEAFGPGAELAADTDEKQGFICLVLGAAIVAGLVSVLIDFGYLVVRP